jgi:hypothetical protein
VITELREWIRGVHQTSGEHILVVALGFLEKVGQGPRTVAIHIEGDGTWGVSDISEINADFRYDIRRQKWLDVGAPLEDESGPEDDAEAT